MTEQNATDFTLLLCNHDFLHCPRDEKSVRITFCIARRQNTVRLPVGMRTPHELRAGIDSMLQQDMHVSVT